MDPVTNQQQPVAAASGHHHHHGGKHAKAVDDAVAKALGMSTSDLAAAKQQGTSIADLAKAKGVSTDDLTKAITQGLQQSDPSLSADRAGQIAARIIVGPQQNGKASASTTAQGHDADGDGDHAGGFSALASAIPSFQPSQVDKVA